MTKASDLQGDITVRTYIPGQGTAGTADSWPLFKCPRNIKVTGVRWIPAAAVSGANTNNFALAAQNKGAANAGTTALTTTKTYASGTDSAANTPEDFVLTSTAADLLCAAGDVLVLVRSINSSGLAMPDGLVEVTYQAK